MWQSEKISKVCLNVVQNVSEGCIREALYHGHSGKEQSTEKRLKIYLFILK